MTIDISTLITRAAQLLEYNGPTATNARAVQDTLIAEFGVTRQRTITAIAHACQQHRGQPDHVRPTRVHNPAWADNTRNERQATRRQRLNAAAQAAGFASWSAYETAIINGAIEINHA